LKSLSRSIHHSLNTKNSLFRSFHYSSPLFTPCAPFALFTLYLFSPLFTHSLLLVLFTFFALFTSFTVVILIRSFALSVRFTRALSSTGAADENWEAKDEDDGEETVEKNVPNLTITSKWGKVSDKNLGARVEVKMPKEEDDKHRVFGILRFCGPDVATRTLLCGIELYEPVGDGSGSFGATEYVMALLLA
jgi:hypothetical protein